MAGKSWTTALRVRRLLEASKRKDRRRLTCYRRRRCRKIIKGAAAGVDIISCLPDAILQHILTFMPTKFAIRTSLLSKRWRHVWCDIPSLSFDHYEYDTPDDASITKTLSYHTAPKMMNFKIRTTRSLHIYKWIEFAISRNVENLSLTFLTYKDNRPVIHIPDFFFINPSVKQLTYSLVCTYFTPKYPVLWTSLRKLYLGSCTLSDESIAKILSGSPVLESLTLYHCLGLMNLDLTKSLRLTTLEIGCNVWPPARPIQIVAPHIHSLTLKNAQQPSTLVDVSSLTEAKMDICFNLSDRTVDAEFLRVMLLKMLEKLRNAEKLTIRGNFLQILSVAELCGVPFPMLNVKYLVLETLIFKNVIPGIERLLQNSPCLKKLILREECCNTLPVCLQINCLDDYLTTQGLNPDQCWRSKDGVFWNEFRSSGESKHVTSFVELVLKNAKTLENMVLLLNEHYLKFKLTDLVMPTLHHNNSVSINIALLYNKTEEIRLLMCPQLF